MQIGSVVWEEFDHIHTYIHTYTRNMANVALSIHVTLNTKPASQVLINSEGTNASFSKICGRNFNEIWHLYHSDNPIVTLSRVWLRAGGRTDGQTSYPAAERRDGFFLLKAAAKFKTFLAKTH